MDRPTLDFSHISPVRTYSQKKKGQSAFDCISILLFIPTVLQWEVVPTLLTDYSNKLEAFHTNHMALLDPHSVDTWWHSY